MFTLDELRDINDALSAANIAIEKDQIAMEGEQTWFGKMLFPNDRQRELDTRKRMYEIAIKQRNLFIEDPNDAHEEALQLIEAAHHIADRQWVSDALKQPSLLDKLGDIGKKIADPILNNPVSDWIAKVLKIASIVAVVLGFLYLYAFLPKPNHIRRSSGRRYAS